MPAASREKVKELAARLKKGERTIWRWVAQGCDLSNEESSRHFCEGKKLRGMGSQKARDGREALKSAFQTDEDWRSRPGRGDAPNAEDRAAEAAINGSGNGGGNARAFLIGEGELPPAGRRGAAAALERLEETEERAHARLLKAMERGNVFQVQAFQDFWLKCSETLRK